MAACYVSAAANDTAMACMQKSPKFDRQAQVKIRSNLAFYFTVAFLPKEITLLAHFICLFLLAVVLCCAALVFLTAAPFFKQCCVVFVSAMMGQLQKGAACFARSSRDKT